MPETPASVMRSILSPAAIAAEVSRTYELPEPVACVLWRSFTNDVYRLTTPTGVFFLKVYGHDWRSAAEITWETDFLAHLAARGVAVAPALPRRDGNVIHVVHAAEGPRCCVLFANAPGTKPRRPFTPELYRRFGRAAGALHLAADTFVSEHRRVALDLAFLLDQSLAAIRPCLADRPADWTFLVRLAETIRTRLTALAAVGLDWGACHGDLTLDCFHLTEDDDLIFYDFDSGGPGWRALEFQGIYAHTSAEVWAAFVEGYTAVRSLGEVDLAAVPWCVPLYAFPDMGWAASQWATWSGQWRLTDEYWDTQVRELAQWEIEHLR